MEKTRVEKVVPTGSPQTTMAKVILTLQAMEDATIEQVDIPEGTVAPGKPAKAGKFRGKEAAGRNSHMRTLTHPQSPMHV